MTRYIVKKVSNKLVVEKRNSKGMEIICKTVLPGHVESVIAAEAARMTRLGLKFQVENRTNIRMDI